MDLDGTIRKEMRARPQRNRVEAVVSRRETDLAIDFESAEGPGGQFSLLRARDNNRLRADGTTVRKRQSRRRSEWVGSGGMHRATVVRKNVSVDIVNGAMATELDRASHNVDLSTVNVISDLHLRSEAVACGDSDSNVAGIDLDMVADSNASIGIEHECVERRRGDLLVRRRNMRLITRTAEHHEENR